MYPSEGNVEIQVCSDLVGEEIITFDSLDVDFVTMISEPRHDSNLDDVRKVPERVGPALVGVFRRDCFLRVVLGHAKSYARRLAEWHGPVEIGGQELSVDQDSEDKGPVVPFWRYRGVELHRSSVSDIDSVEILRHKGLSEGNASSSPPDRDTRFRFERARVFREDARQSAIGDQTGEYVEVWEEGDLDSSAVDYLDLCVGVTATSRAR